MVNTAVLASEDKSIRDDIRARGFEKHPDLERLLVRSLAAAQIGLHFERTYNLIFDSQLTLLRVLNTNASGLPVADLRQRYPFGIKLVSDFSFDDWLAYLRNAQLVEIEGESLHITEMGREFLKYLIDMRQPDRGVY